MGLQRTSYKLIRDRLVCGVRDDTLQRTLLAVAKLTLDKAFELSVVHEAAAQNARLLRGPLSTMTVHFAAPAGLPKDLPPRESCYCCGGSHYAKDCRFKDAKCNHCHKKGHIQRVCRSRSRQQQSRSPQPPPANSRRDVKRQTHKMEEEDEPSSRSSTNAAPVAPQAPPVEPLPVNYDLFAVGTDKKVDPYLMSVDIDGATLLMEIDTGSALTLISQATFSTLWNQENSPRLENTSIRLRTYSGEELEVVGRAVVTVRCGREEVGELGLVVVGGKGPSLLGRDWLGRLRLDWREVRMLNATPNSLEAVLSKHSDLFRDELGTIRGITDTSTSPGARHLRIAL